MAKPTTMEKITAAGMKVVDRIRKAVRVKKYDPKYEWQISADKGYGLMKKQKAIESASSRSRKYNQHPDTKLGVDPASERGQKIQRGIADDIENQTAKEKAKAFNRTYRKKPKKSGVDFR